MNSAYLEGWYLKQQGENGTLTFIPCCRRTENGERAAVLRIITPEGHYDFGNLPGEFCSTKKRFCVQIGDSVFSDHGCRLNIAGHDVKITGTLWYGLLHRPHYSRRDALRFAFGRRRRRRIFSMEHSVNGRITVNGKDYLFRDGTGYVEEGRTCTAITPDEVFCI